MSSTFKWKENGKGISLPDTFKCRVCSKIKPANNDHYSKKELKPLASRATYGKPVTTFNANVRCRNCSGENVFELQCQNCLVTKSKDDFSYSQRTAALSARCKACVNWQEANEAGMETLPGPSMALQPDANIAAGASNNPTQANALSVLVNSTAHAGDDDGDESSVWRTTQPSNNTMSVPTGTSLRPTTTKASVTQTFPVPKGFMAPTRKTYIGEDPESESTVSNPYGSRPSSPVSDIFAKLDPFSHRGAKASKVNAGGSDAVSTSVSGSDKVANAPAGGMWTTPVKKAAESPMAYDVPGSSTTAPAPREDTWTAVATKKNKAATKFIGWDNQGVAHEQTVSPSDASTTAPSVFGDNVASGRYGRPGRTTPRRESGGNSGGAWFKSTKPAKGDTANYGFESYAPADLAEYAPPVKKAGNDGWESEDEM
ncbi:hypothetical protein V494_07424 [Pseudogymnoascus sp. VKM F-4513 (FW-928)]|nr:hypothetical protein V494_07424 [Pseudogymnoascus sp. VKM F-4513 (FW-928)]